MLAGRALISVTSNLEASLLIQTHSQLAVVPVSKPITPADLAFIVTQEDQVWLNFLNHWITIKQNRGFFEKLKDKWILILILIVSWMVRRLESRLGANLRTAHRS